MAPLSALAQSSASIKVAFRLPGLHRADLELRVQRGPQLGRGRLQVQSGAAPWKDGGTCGRPLEVPYASTLAHRNPVRNFLCTSFSRPFSVEGGPLRLAVYPDTLHQGRKCASSYCTEHTSWGWCKDD